MRTFIKWFIPVLILAFIGIALYYALKAVIVCGIVFLCLLGVLGCILIAGELDRQWKIEDENRKRNNP